MHLELENGDREEHQMATYNLHRYDSLDIFGIKLLNELVKSLLD